MKVDAAINLVAAIKVLGIGGVQSSMPATTVIMRYCDQPASRVGIRLLFIRHIVNF